MTNINIHPTAIVSDKAKLGRNVSVGPYSIIEDDVVIGENTEIRSSCVIGNGARIGNNCKIFASAVISSEPQDLKYSGEATQAIIGENTVIREYVTINRGTIATGSTNVGSNCLIMAYCHVAHDCEVGNNVIMANSVQLAGHVEIEDWVVIGGVVKIHQFCKIGCHAMIGADVYCSKDVPPYTLVAKNPPQINGVNKVGLRRRGFSNSLVREIEQFYDTVLFSGLNNSAGIEKFREQGPVSDEVEYCINFIQDSTRGIYR